MAGALGQEEKEVFAAYLAKNHLKRSEHPELEAQVVLPVGRVDQAVHGDDHVAETDRRG